ncbi:MAG: radical SAM protein [Crenarchaeota archaeon]|nr:radical SAM protein [Thermoproteota archaeon]
MKILLVDGYSDEPAGLGVPPYIDVYPRYIAGAIWSVDSSIEVRYVTIDDLRRDLTILRDEWKIMIVIAGVTTPGKYLKYSPITFEEIVRISNLARSRLRILCGPVARFGYISEGGDIAVDPSIFRRYYDLVISGDPDLVIYDLLRSSLDMGKIDPSEIHEDDSLINIFAVKGSRIVVQHPCYGKNLIAEIETYRSCPRYVTGGCSFCITVRRGVPLMRDVRGVVREVEALCRAGVKNFRIGRQADILTYFSKDVGKLEFPRPRPDIIERLFHGIRSVARGLEVLHIDNVNPGTIYHWPIESIECLKIIMMYHTPGDVAAMGVETADPRVVKINNLKVSPEEAYEAVKIVSKLGDVRGWNGMPHLLPGINFVLGLPGETKETYDLNRDFLKKLLENNIKVRRVNIRLAAVFPGTPLWAHRDTVYRNLRRHRKYIESFRYWVRHVFDIENLQRILPRGSILKNLFTEIHDREGTYCRQVGSYPLIVYVPEKLELERWIDIIVVDHLPRSVIGVPYPVDINRAPVKLLKKIPGMSEDKLRTVIARRPIENAEDLKKLLGDSCRYFKLR